MSTYKIRPARADELPLVFDSWAKSFKLPRPTRWRCGTVVEVDPFVDLAGGRTRGLAPHLWMHAMRSLVEGLAEEASIAVAVHQSNPDVVVGWVCFDCKADGATLHYVWSRPELRRQGVARQLLNLVIDAAEGQPIRATHMTEAGRMLLLAAQESP